MGRKRHTPEQIITALREAEVGLARGKSVKLISRELGITEQTYSRSSPRRSPRQPNRSIEELPLTFTHNSGLDLTYVPTWAGWLYLAVVLDALEPPRRRLGDGAAHAGRTGRGRTGDGDLATTAERRGGSSLRQ